MIFLIMPEEVGVCEFYGTRSVQVIPEEPEQRKDYGKVETARGFLNKCPENMEACQVFIRR